MNINYLILAHANYRTLDSLIEELDNINVKFYIHIDKKSSNLYFNKKTNVYILNKRFNINWGGFSMIKATLELLKNSFNNDFDPNTRYVLLSGADYPIRPNFFIEELLKTEWEYINLSSAPLSHKPMSRYKYFYFDYDRRNSKSVKTKFFKKLEKLLIKFNLKRKIPFKIYVGSQWFALTKSCVKYILNQVELNPNYISFFKYSLIPDEAFFQTIIGNSEYSEKVKSNITFTDWSSSPSPIRITEKHIDILNSRIVFDGGDYGKYIPLFARKFDDKNIYLTKVINKSLRKTLPNDNYK